MANNNQNQPKKDESYANYQQAGQQLLQMNAERQKNIALQKQANANQQGTTELLSQAGAMATMGGGGVSINPQTQAMLRKYGYGQPKVQRTQSREVKVVPNNIVVNNNYNTVTNNNVIPLQQGGGNDAANNQSRFKTWISGIFARQKEETAKRDREYQKQEWAIGKSTNRMLRQMTDAGRNVANAINPKNIGTTLGGQLKTLLFIFGMRFLAKNWTLILEKAEKIYLAVKKGFAFFGVGDKTEVEALAAQGKDFRGRFIEFFAGSDRARDGKTTIISLLKEMMTNFGDFIKTFIEGQMEIRGIAMKSIKFPKLDFKPADSSGWNPLASMINSAISSLGDSLTTALSGMGTYLGDIFTAFVSPKAGARRAITSNTNRIGANEAQKAQEFNRNVSKFTEVFANDGTSKFGGIAVNAGDAANELVGKDWHDTEKNRDIKGGRRYSLLEDAISGDKLKNTAGAQISQGRDLLGAIKDVRKYGRLDSARFASGINRLYQAAKSNEDGVIVDQEFVNTLISDNLRKNLTSTRDLVPVKMKYVIADMTEQEYDNRGAALYRDAGGGIGGYGHALGEEAGNKLNPINYVNNKKLVLVPLSDPRPAVTNIKDFFGSSLGNVKDLGKPADTYYRLTPTAIEKLVQHQVGKDAKIEKYETLLPGVEKLLYRAGGGKETVDSRWANANKTNADFIADRFGNNQKDYDVSKGFEEIRRIELAEQKLRSSMENHPFMTYVRNVEENTKKGANYLADRANDVVNWFGTTDIGRGMATERITNQQIRANAQKIMDYLINVGKFTPEQALGIVGNLYRESALNPGAVNNNDRGKQSIGLAQWRAERNNGLRTFANRKGTRWNDLNTQLDYLMMELGNDERAAGNAVRRAGTFQEAAYAWRNFERYAGYKDSINEGENAIRQKKTWSIYNMLKKDGYFEGKRIGGSEASIPIERESSNSSTIIASAPSGGNLLNGSGNEVTSEGITRARINNGDIGGSSGGEITIAPNVVSGPAIEIKGSEESIFGDNVIGHPFKNVKSDEEMKQQEVKSALAREAMSVWNKYPRIKEGWEDYNSFENYWITKDSETRKKLKRGFMAYHNHYKAINSDPTLSKLGIHRFAEIWASRPKEPWEMMNRIERARKFDKISVGAKDFVDKLTESDNYEEIKWILDSLNEGPDSDPFNSLRGTAWQERSHTTKAGKKKALEDLYNDVLEGKRTAGYNDKVAADILFKDEYEKLRKELDEVENTIKTAKDKGTPYMAAEDKQKRLKSKMKIFEDSASNYVTEANGKNKTQRRNLYVKNQEIAQIRKQLMDYEDEKKAISARANMKLMTGNLTDEDVMKLDLEVASDFAWINEKEEELRKRLSKVIEGLGEGQEEFKEKIEQEIKLQSRTSKELWGEYNDIINSGKSQVEAIGEMMRKYGETVLEKMREELAKTVDFFKNHELTKEMMDTNYDVSKGIITKEQIDKEKEDLIAYYGSWEKVPVVEKWGIDNAYKRIRDSYNKSEETLQGKQELIKAGVLPEHEIKGKEKFESVNKGKLLSDAYSLEGERVLRSFPGFEEGWNSKVVTKSNPVPLGVSLYGNYDSDSGVRQRGKSGKAVGGYTEPGNPLTPSGYVLHKNEFVVNSGSLKNPLISDIVKAIDVYQGTNKDTVKTPISKESILTAESSKITAINTAETNARLEQLTQAVLNLGRSGGTPKTKVPSYTP